MYKDHIRKFQNDPKCRFLVGTPQTGGYGITLTQANTVVYYSNGYDLEKRLQSEDRAHRIGQKKSVTYVDFITPKTIKVTIINNNNTEYYYTIYFMPTIKLINHINHQILF